MSNSLEIQVTRDIEGKRNYTQSRSIFWVNEISMRSHWDGNKNHPGSGAYQVLLSYLLLVILVQ